jgi:hypothetical protein
MEIPFPTSSSSWTAPDPFTWSTALRESLSHPTPSFRNALRELAGRGQIPPGLNDQSLWILIHGLINVSWTLLWRDLGELSMVHENKITGWKDSLRRAFKIWVGYVEGRGSVRDEALFSVGIPFAQLGKSSSYPGCIKSLSFTISSVFNHEDQMLITRINFVIERYRDDSDLCRCSQYVPLFDHNLIMTIAER